MPGLGQAVALVQHVLRPQAVIVAPGTLQMVVRFHAKRIGFAMPVQEAQALPGALRHAQNAVGDIGFAAAMHL